MLSPTYPYFLANRPVAANTDLEVLDKYSGAVATRVAFADAATVRKAIDHASDARAAMAAWSSACPLAPAPSSRRSTFRSTCWRTRSHPPSPRVAHSY